MVDKALFIGTSAAKDAMHHLATITNNLANVATPGFREDLEGKQSVSPNGKGQQTRSYSAKTRMYANFQPGPVINTGRDLDVAISGKGFIAVQSKQGGEGYTRAGDFEIKNGFLTTQSGDLVMGTGGVINIPPTAERISIGADGTISAKLKGTPDLINVGKIKLTNPAESQLIKGKDGLFYFSDGISTAQADKNIKLIPGSIEGSNVNPVEAMTDLIELSREFEMHTDLMKSIKDDSSKANEILALPR